jgi:hypothetical protein
MLELFKKPHNKVQFQKLLALALMELCGATSNIDYKAEVEAICKDDDEPEEAAK